MLQLVKKEMRVVNHMRRDVQNKFLTDRLGTPEKVFERNVTALVNAGLMRPSDAEPFRKFVPQHGLFLLVPPRPEVLDFGHLVSLIVIGHKQGLNYLARNAKFEDVVRIPTGSYIAAGADDGQMYRNTELAEVEWNVRVDDRSPYTAFEGVIHALVFPEALEQNHFMDLCGSRYRNVNVPGLCKSIGRARLVYDLSDHTCPAWGAASCTSRIDVQS